MEAINHTVQMWCVTKLGRLSADKTTSCRMGRVLRVTVCACARACMHVRMCEMCARACARQSALCLCPVTISGQWAEQRASAQVMMMMMTLKEVRPTVVRGLALQA